MKKVNLTTMFLFLATISKQNMNNFLKHKIETNVLWSLIKNVVTSSKGNSYLKAQQYTILIMVVNEVTWTCLFKLHIKLSIAWPTLREINTFPIISWKKIWNQIQWKKMDSANSPSQRFTQFFPSQGELFPWEDKN
jgi:hypothetical protein